MREGIEMLRATGKFGWVIISKDISEQAKECRVPVTVFESEGCFTGTIFCEEHKDLHADVVVWKPIPFINMNSKGCDAPLENICFE